MARCEPPLGSLTLPLTLALTLALALVLTLTLTLALTLALALALALTLTLTRCEPPLGSAAAVRASLRFDASSGLISTTHRLRALRTRLPEQALGCGFWPNCTQTRAVLAKACWARLASDPRACGKEEASLATRLGLRLGLGLG